MGVKIDKRTNAYKNSVAVRGENDSLEQPSPLKQVESTATTGTVEECPIEHARNERIDNVIIEAAAKGIQTKPDLLHCPGCGAELLEDERNGKSAAYCRKCIWRNA